MKQNVVLPFPKKARKNRLYEAALAMPARVYRRWLASQKEHPIWQRVSRKEAQPIKAPPGVNPALSQIDPGKTLRPEGRDFLPGNTAVERSDEPLI